jgi:hypothetical protein
VKTKILALVAGAAALAFLAVAPVAHTSAQTPAVPGRVLNAELRAPRGMALGPDGMLYVAEAGSGGSTEVTLPDGSTTKVGTTGRISKIDPATGTRTTVADNLPSNAGPEGDSVGPADVAFIGNTLYYIQTHGGAAFGFPNTPTGLYRVNANGTTTLIADIGKFNIDNPVTDVSSGAQQDIEPGGNPYAMTVRDGAFWVTDGNQNQIMKITTAGEITRIAEFSGHPVTTGIAYKPSGGPFYVTTLGQFPFNASDGNVFTHGTAAGGAPTKVAGGISSLTGVAIGPDGNVYVVNFGDQAATPDPVPWALFSGAVSRVNSDGTLTPVIKGFLIPTDILFDGNKLYINNDSISALGPGEIRVIDDFAAAAAAGVPTPTAVPTTAPAPTPTKPSGIVGPNTGTGGYASAGNDGDFSLVALIALGAAAALLCAGGVAIRAKSR